LALFGRRPSVPGDSFVIPASENLHKNGKLNASSIFPLCRRKQTLRAAVGCPLGAAMNRHRQSFDHVISAQ